VPPICEYTVDGTGKVDAFESRGSRDLIALPPELGAVGCHREHNAFTCARSVRARPQ
jgi:hypothetical protein